VRQIFYHDRLHFREVELLGRLHVMNRLKVDSVEEFVTHEIIHVRGAQPKLRVHGEQLSNQILCEWWDSFWHFEESLSDLIKSALLALAFKWYLPSKGLINDDAKSPEVASVVTLLRVYHLRRDVVLRADYVFFIGRYLLDKTDF
jgi:hypothetical protein